jgi:hypothetical protein
MKSRLPMASVSWRASTSCSVDEPSHPCGPCPSRRTVDPLFERHGLYR